MQCYINPSFSDLELRRKANEIRLVTLYTKTAEICDWDLTDICDATGFDQGLHKKNQWYISTIYIMINIMIFSC